MSDQSSPRRLEALRAIAREQGVEPTDGDLESVLGFLDVILPALERIEAELPPEAEP